MLFQFYADVITYICFIPYTCLANPFSKRGPGRLSCLSGQLEELYVNGIVNYNLQQNYFDEYNTRDWRLKKLSGIYLIM